jgi:hypothetical protein
MFAVLTEPVEVELVSVGADGDGMTETPLVKFAESLLLSAVQTSLIETRSRDEVRLRL